MAVLLGVYRIVNSIGFNERWKAKFYRHNDLINIVNMSENEINRQEKILFFNEYNYI